MHIETLNVMILNAAKDAPPANLKLLKNFPKLQILGQASGLQDCLSQHRKMALDLVVIDLHHAETLPEWLEDLTQSLPQTAVMICSHNQEREFLIRAMQLGVREFLPLPLTLPDLKAALERIEAAKRRRVPTDATSGQVVVVTGLRGGVGATSIAVNLAVALAARHPGRVALVDLGRPYPNVAKFLNLEKKNNLLNLAENKDHLDSSFVLRSLQPHEANLAVLHGPNFNEFGLIDPELLEKVCSILRTLFDWIVVDLSHWPDEIYLKVCQEADQVVLLTELLIPDLQNLKKLWSWLQQSGLDKEKVRIVVNRYHKDNGLGLEDLERLQQQPVFFTLPSDYPALSESINQGVPLARLAPRSRLCRRLQRLAGELAGQASTQEDTTKLPFRRRFLFF
jgi:pilus assembly protein CpaE